MKNFKKWPILVSLPNWPLLGIAGTFRAAVCGTMLSGDCTLSAYIAGAFRGAVCGTMLSGDCTLSAY